MSALSVRGLRRERLHTELDEPYIANPDRVIADPLSATELRRAWAEVNDKLTRAFIGFTLEDWLQNTQLFPMKDSSRTLWATGLLS